MISRYFFSLSAVLVLFVFINSVFATEQNTSVKYELSEIANEAKSIASQYHKLGWFSGNVLLAKDGRVFHSSSFGYKNLESKNHNSALTRFNLGSIMKDFTSVLVLQQVEANNLNLDDTLSKFKLGFPEEIASRITVRHLLRHESGFADIFTAEYRENQLNFDSIDKKLTLLRDKPLLFEPGTDSRYSNYGYIVLGAILEKVTNIKFHELLRANVFEVLDLKHSQFFVDSSSKNQSARYTFTFDGKLREVGVTEHPSPDGGIESTTRDVQKFYRKLFYSDTLLSHSKPIIKEKFAIGGSRWTAYGGGAGVSAAVEVDLKNGFEIVVLANTDKLVAELISGRVLSFIVSGKYNPIKLPETNFAYVYYQKYGREQFVKNFKDAYQKEEYSLFIGRVINELGMQMIESGSWSEAFDMFNYLALLFPTAPQAYDSLAYAHYKKGNTQKAKEVFSKALELNPDFISDYKKDNYQ